MDHSIVVIENGRVSGRKLGDGPSHIVFESMHEGTADVHDREIPTTKTTDGELQVLDHLLHVAGKPVGISGINFDITLVKAFERSLDSAFPRRHGLCPSPSPLPTSATCSRTC